MQEKTVLNVCITCLPQYDKWLQNQGLVNQQQARFKENCPEVLNIKQNVINYDYISTKILWLGFGLQWARGCTNGKVCSFVYAIQ